MPRTRLLAVLALSFAMAGCGAARPFTVPTPGLETLQEEDAYLYVDRESAASALGATSLERRVTNLRSTYQAELARAEAAQGGFLNATLGVLGILLPVSGTASALALSDPDHVEAVGVATGVATTVIMGLDLILKPGQKNAEAAECAGFLASALEAIRLQWGEGAVDLEGTPEEWNVYLTLRGTLEPARAVACSD